MEVFHWHAADASGQVAADAAAAAAGAGANAAAALEIAAAAAASDAEAVANAPQEIVIAGAAAFDAGDASRVADDETSVHCAPATSAEHCWMACQSDQIAEVAYGQDAHSNEDGGVEQAAYLATGIHEDKKVHGQLGACAAAEEPGEVEEGIAAIGNAAVEPGGHQRSCWSAEEPETLCWDALEVARFWAVAEADHSWSCPLVASFGKELLSSLHDQRTTNETRRETRSCQ